MTPSKARSPSVSLSESQQFFFDLCSRPGTILNFKRDRKKVLKKYFRSVEDQAELSRYPAERFQTYRNHISFGILGGIRTAFPVLCSLVSEEEWCRLLNDFYLRRKTRSPMARHVFYEFSQYLRGHSTLLKKLKARFPYLSELADYESLEIKIKYALDQPVQAELPKNTLTQENLPKLIPVPNPHLEFRMYHWPVHHICREFCSTEKIKRGNYLLVVYRDPKNLEVRFIEGNLRMAQMMKILQRGQKNIRQILKHLMKKSRIKDKGLFYREAITTLGCLYQKNIIVGYRTS